MTNRIACPYRLQQRVLFIAVLLAGAALCSAPLPAQADDDLGPHLKGFTREQVLQRGEAMYRNGILPTGEPMQALVMGDVPVEGTMFTCVSCHLRSGFGSNEGQVRMPPIDGTRLYSSVSKSRRAPLVGQQTTGDSEDLYRPAYTDETLARVIETGIDPAGRQLNTVMPIYFLNEQDREILVYYLKYLSTEPQPGVTETTLHFATVISEDVPAEDREAMVGSLQKYVTNWRLPRTLERGMRSSLYKREGAMKGLRTFTLSVWELKGPPETWREQLEGYYQKDPVFALLGGITTREWAPIHRFCEDHLIPAIFPVTDFPVISETDWYTLYLSKGLYQEGEAAARFLHGREDLPKTPIVQIIRDEPAGLALSKGFQDTWVSLGHEAPDTVMLKRDEPIPASFWKKPVGKNKHAVVLLWLGAADFPDLKLLAKGSRPAMVFASAGFLGRHINTLAESERGYVYLTYPYSLPREPKGQRTQAGTSPQDNKVPMTKRDTTLKIHTLTQTISDPLAKMRSFVSRDSFLELIESAPDITALPAIYPRLSFGTGQRYASKGCYIVQLGAGPNPELVKKSEWVIH